MGFLDDIAGKVLSAVGGGEGGQSALVGEVLGLLGGGGAGGGLQGVIRSFQDKGLGDIVSSWVGTGQNLPINIEQLKQGLGGDVIGQLAAKAGLPADIATANLAQILPSIIDRLTPEGRVPEANMLKQGLELLRSNLPKS